MARIRGGVRDFGFAFVSFSSAKPRVSYVTLRSGSVITGSRRGFWLLCYRHSQAVQRRCYRYTIYGRRRANTIVLQGVGGPCSTAATPPLARYTHGTLALSLSSVTLTGIHKQHRLLCAINSPGHWDICKAVLRDRLGAVALCRRAARHPIRRRRTRAGGLPCEDHGKRTTATHVRQVWAPNDSVC